LDDIIRTAGEMVSKERRILELCRSSDYSFDELRKEVKTL
jgi:hypothetical protein